MPRIFMAVILLPVLALTAPAEPAPPFAAAVAPLIADHCAGCHGARRPKAGLDLTSLPPAFDNPKAAAAWVRVVDELSAGRMPPKGRDRPDPPGVRRAVAVLNAGLHRAAAARRATEGRVPIRRLNRTEYGNAVRDLLGITATFDNLLPEDSVSAGFDTVAAGLDTSATHFVRYQAAAERALAEAVPAHPIARIHSRMTGKQFVDNMYKPYRDALLPYSRIDGEAVLIYANVGKHAGPRSPQAPATGRYRFRAAVRAVNTAGRPLPVLFGRISSDNFATEKLQHIFAVRDARPDKATVVELEVPLPADEQIYIAAWHSLPEMEAFQKAVGKAVPPGFGGLALAVEWFELDGPFAPNAGRHLLFGDVAWEPRVGRKGGTGQAEAGRLGQVEPQRVRQVPSHARPRDRRPQGGRRPAHPSVPAKGVPPPGVARAGRPVRPHGPRPARRRDAVPRGDAGRVQGGAVLAALPDAGREAGAAGRLRRRHSAVPLLVEFDARRGTGGGRGAGRICAGQSGCGSRWSGCWPTRRPGGSPRTSPASGSTCARSTT